MWDIFKNRNSPIPDLFTTDLHSHILPGIDDGVTSLEEAAAVIRGFMDVGFTKAITTPHIMSDTHRNTPETILPRLDELNEYLTSQKIPFIVEAAAEYYLDEAVVNMIAKNIPFMTFGRNYLLFETNTYSDPLLLNDFIFQTKVKGYQPVMAHPERYRYLNDNFERVQDLIDRGVLMQVNSLSLSGHYSKSVQKMANQLINRKMVHFLGSDCHTPHQARLLKEVIKSKYFLKALELPLINYSL